MKNLIKLKNRIYLFMLTTLLATSVFAQISETEPNDTCEQATPMLASTTYNGSVGPSFSDVDVYKFNVSANSTPGTTITITIDNDASGTEALLAIYKYLDGHCGSNIVTVFQGTVGGLGYSPSGEISNFESPFILSVEPGTMYNVSFFTNNGVEEHYNVKIDLSPGVVIEGDPAPPVPDEFSDANLWYNAGAGVTTGATFTWENQANPTDPNDQVTGNADVSQSTAANQPTYNTTGAGLINFNPSITFDGVNDVLESAALSDYLGVDGSGDKIASQFVVYKKLETTSGGEHIYNIDDNSDIFLGAKTNGRMLQEGRRKDLGTAASLDEIVLVDMISTSSTTLANEDFSLFKNGLSNDGPYGGGFASEGSGDMRFGRHQSDYGNFAIAEVVVFPKRISTSLQKEVQSYLAIKYGISLGDNNGLALYYNSSGLEVYVSITHNQDVFGIAKDDAAGLNQTQSNSMNTGSGDGTGQSGKGNIVLSNPSGLDDGDYLIMGHDNGVLTQESTDLPISLDGSLRLAREWKVSHTNNVGTVDLSFSTLGLALSGTTASDFKLIIDEDGNGDFTDGTITVVDATSFSGDVASFTGVTLVDSALFTIVTGMSNPGGVAGANLWLKADNGLTESGGTLTGWSDQTGINTFTVNGTPGYASDAINFNPVATFDNAETPTQQPGDYLEGNTSITYQDGFAVFKKTNVASGALIGSTVSMDAYGTAIFAGYSDNQIWMSDGAGSGGSWSRFENSNVTAGNVALVGYDISAGLVSSAVASLNGAGQTMIAGPSGGNAPSAAFIPRIGGTNNSGGIVAASGWTHFRGEVAEMILFSTPTNAADKIKIQSYLALKYGITLDNSVTNYLTSDDTVIWDNTTYWNDVFGIGQDNGSGLAQTASNSMNTGSGDGTGQSGLGNIVLSNPSSLDDGDYLILGHDNLGLTEQETDLPASFSTGTERLAREWKVKQTNDVGTVDLSFSTLGLTLTGTDVSAFKLIIDTDGNGDFTDGTVTVVDAASLIGDVVSFTGITLIDNAVFTFVTGENTLSIKNEDLFNLAIHPNPTNGEFTVQFKEPLNNATIKIFNMLGQTISEQEVGTKDRVKLNIDGSNGIYLLEITSEGKSMIKKIVKQ